MEVIEDFKNYLTDSLQGVQFVEGNDELTLLFDSDILLSICRFLRDDSRCLFKMCIDICGVDYPERPRRFDVVYHLLSLKYNKRIRLKIQVDEHSPVPSIIDVWPSAGWYEREVWDMYGVLFSNHPDLRRILTDYNFCGHPQRRDFPLSGYVEVRYDPESGRVRYESVKLPQAFRNFSFLSPWAGYEDILHGDEKAAFKDSQ